jgi:DegV family protein with EDD domain
MARPSVLVIDPESSRRRALSRGLAEMGYEVIPAVDRAQGRRFVDELEPGVVVVPLAVLGGDELSHYARGGGAASAERRVLLVLGRSEREGQELPENVRFLATDDLLAGDGADSDSGIAADAGAAVRGLVERVHLVLLGRELGVEPDLRLESLVGDFALTPLLELLRGLRAAGVTGRLVHGSGEIRVEAGEVVGASSGRTHGLKAFCRLSYLDQGPFRVLLGELPGPSFPLGAAARGAAGAPSPSGGAGAGESQRAAGSAGSPRTAGPPGSNGDEPLGLDLKSLIIQALEDRVHDAPDARSRVRLEIGSALFEGRFTPGEKALLAAVPGSATVGRLLEALPATDGEILRDLERLRERGVVVLEEPEAAVSVVTDSTADLPAELARAHGIRVVPLLVLFGERIYHDGVDIRPREFYEQLAAGKVHPRTNPPLKGDFIDAYRGLAARQDIVSVHISGRLSQTVVQARAAVIDSAALTRLRGEADPPLAIEVVDSGQVSLGLGMLALFAARMARRRLTAGEIARRLEAMRDRVHVLFVVDTLDYLARGGRIGKARALLGNLFGIKPILGVVGGEVVPVERVRGGRAAHPRLIELFRERVKAGRPVMVGVAHAKAPVWADRLRASIETSFRVGELVMTEIGPVVGTHAGPGLVGAAMFQPTAEELPLIAPFDP